MENKELLEKARQAGSPDELLALARENGYPLDENEARDYFERLGKSGELSDDELDSVSGGGCSTNVNGKKYTVVTSMCKCFTGQFAVNDDGRDYIRKDNEGLRRQWWNMGCDRACGRCIHLGFKNGLGYCELSDK